MSQNYDRVTKPFACFCGSAMTLREGKFGSFYGCNRWPDCEGTATLHPDGSLKSTPADRQTKDARIKAHRAFDRMWKSGYLTRDQAYTWMAEKMGLELDRAHIGYFSESQCNELIELVLNELVNEVGP